MDSKPAIDEEEEEDFENDKLDCVSDSTNGSATSLKLSEENQGKVNVLYIYKNILKPDFPYKF